MNRKHKGMIAISTTSLATAGCLTGSFIVSAQHLSNVTYIAHRGLCSKAYQNSKEAFQLAAANPNIGGIETDVGWTKTDASNPVQLVCSHDPNPYAEGDENDAYIPNHFGSEMATKTLDPNRTNDYKVPIPQPNYLALFSEYVKICEDNHKKMYIELKQPSKAGIIPEYDEHADAVYAQPSGLTGLVEIITGAGDHPSALNDVAFISFDNQLLQYAKAAVEFSYGNMKPRYMQLAETDAKCRQQNGGMGLKDMMDAGFDPDVSVLGVTNSLINYAHEHGKLFGVWGKSLIDYPTTGDLFIKMGIDFITSDWAPNFNW